MSAGSITCSTLADVQLKAEQIWADNAAKKDYVAKVEVLTAIRKEQTSKLVDLENPTKDKTVKMAWVKDCDTSTSACGTECTVGGNEAEIACQSMTLDICRTAGFTVDEKELRSNLMSKEDFLAVLFMRKLKVLDEYLAVQAVSKIDSFKGANTYTGGKGTVSGFSTTVAPAYWNGSLFSYLYLVAQKNKFSDPYLLSGTNLFEAYYNAQANAGNADGKGTATLFDSFRTYFDVFNIDTVLDPDKATFLIDKNAIAFASKTYYPWSAGDARAQQYGGAGGSVGIKYQIASPNLPGVFYDVTHKVTCSGDEIKHNFTLAVNAGIFRNPVGCDLNNTGILKFKCA